MNYKAPKTITKVTSNCVGVTQLTLSVVGSGAIEKIWEFVRYKLDKAPIGVSWYSSNDTMILPKWFYVNPYFVYGY